MSSAGEVTAFDDAVGLGTVRTDAGDELLFHCTQIADGSRHIDVGTAVTFEVLAGRHGRWEAGTLRAPPAVPSDGPVAERMSDAAGVDRAQVASPSA